MRKMMALALLLLLLGTMAAHAHGQAADDCPPGSNDPDCATDAAQPKNSK